MTGCSWQHCSKETESSQLEGLVSVNTVCEACESTNLAQATPSIVKWVFEDGAIGFVASYTLDVAHDCLPPVVMHPLEGSVSKYLIPVFDY